ncbi:hypothetical protein AA309_20045 [Microvirga vignae]|uniref:Uncharacterized protein n=1 Tax=Microvirga vignae TaxID=1225564 RepID=A0A0H1R987_9HYPH|nr:hypothetical protein [Microvirga vignae]KLK91396.1 hypothetical protein AA309_20045 [Microvirga vignae]
MGDGKDSKRGSKGAKNREVRAHVLKVLKQLLPKGGKKKKGAGDTQSFEEVARAGAIGRGH